MTGVRGPTGASGVSDRRARDLQVGRIARQLGVPAMDVTGLDDVPVEDLRALHAQMTEALFGDAREGFAKIASLAALLPTPVTALLAERFVPPEMAARVCEALAPEAGRELVGRLRTSYLADVAVLLDPVRARPVVSAMAADQVAEVTSELFGRGEHAVTADLVNAVSTAGLAASLAIATPQDVVAVAPLLEWGPALDAAVAGLPDVRAAALATELTDAELADLAVDVDPARMGPVVVHLGRRRLGRVRTLVTQRAGEETAARLPAR